MAIDPMYIALEPARGFRAPGGADALGADARARLEAARARSSVGYDAVRRAKDDGLWRAFDRFVGDEWCELTTRAAELAAYIARERWWLDDFALYGRCRRN